MLTLNVNESFTGATTQVMCSGATDGSTTTGGGASYSYTRTCTPNMGFEIDGGGDGMSYFRDRFQGQWQETL